MERKRASVSQRRYYQTDFARPSFYDPPDPTPDPTPAPRPPPAPRPQPTPTPDPTPDDPAAPDSSSRGNLPVTMAPRPLKKMSTLTQEQLEKGRMVVASYEIDHQINQEMQNNNISEEKATEDILLTKSNSVLRQTELAGYKTIEALSDKQYLVLEKENEVKVIFRGRAGKNTPDNTHVLDALKGKSRDYGYIDDLMGDIQVLRPDANVEVISYSNGGPKGIYLSEKYGVPHYTIDPVLGPREIALLAKRTQDSAPLDLVRTNKPALASGMGQTAQQIITGDEAHINTINVAPLQYEQTLNPLTKIMDAHDISHYALMDEEFNHLPESNRGRIGVVGRNALGSVVSGVVPAALASVLVENITPEAPHEAKLAETALTTSVITKVAAPLMGAGSAGVVATALPLYASFQAADKVGQAAEAILPKKLQGIPREVIKGGVSGAAGGAVFSGTAAAQSATFSALTSATTATTATTVAAEGVELGVLGGVEAGLVTATEVTGAAAAGELGLNPIADGLFLASATGAGIGAAFGLVSGLFHHH